ncbi:MAG: hypothetical protein ACR2JE_13410 [Acidobacteriaceae bacterium]
MHRQSVLLIALTALAAVLPLLLRGASCGHDFDFHLLSWMEVARDWHQGLPWPHWIASANYGAGEPRLVFYPPGSWLLGAALRSLVGLTAAPAMFTAVCLFGGGVAMYRLARIWLADAPASAAAGLYVANPYTLFVAYERSAYGELLAAAILPLLLLCALRRRPSITGLSLTTAAIWLANAPAGVIAIYTLVVIAVIRLLIGRRVRPLLRIAAGGALGLALAAFYLVPAVYEERWVEIRRAIHPGMRIEDSFLFAHTGDVFHDAVLHTASWIAMLLFAVWLAGAFLWWRGIAGHSSTVAQQDATSGMVMIPAAAKPVGADNRLLTLAVLAPLILCLLLPVSDVLWRHAPELAFLQFSWRWLMLLCVISALFCAGGLEALRIRLARPPGAALVLAGIAAVIAVSIAVSTTHFYQPCDDEDAIAAQHQVFLQGTGVEGTDEYTPRGADNSAIQQGLPLVRLLRAPDAESVDSSRGENPAWRPDPAAEIGNSGITNSGIDVQRWTAERKRIVVESARSGYLVLRLMDYPAWQVRRNGVLLGGRPRRKDGLLVAPVTAGHTTIDVRWPAMRDVWIGRATSLLALCILAGLLLSRRKRTTRPV